MKGIMIFSATILFIISLSALSACPDTDLGNGSNRYITTPSDRQTVRGIQTIAVTPPDKFSIDHVDFFIDAILKKTVSQSPYTYEWDTQNYTNGQHQISVNLYSVDGTTLSDAITVYVNN